MNDEFGLLYARVERACSHRNEMWSIQAKHLQTHPIEHSVEKDNDRIVFKLQAPAPFPVEASVVFGEWLYNLRAALDGLFYELMVHETRQDPPPNAGQLAYPLFTSPEDFAARAKLKRLSERLCKAIECTQPYHATGGHTGSALWWIHELARLDRHRRGHLLVWRITDFKLDLPLEAIDVAHSRICDRFAAYIRHEQQLELARIVLNPGFDPGPDDGIGIYRKIQFDIPDWVARSPRTYAQWSLDDRMANAEEVVYKTIESFESYLS